MLVPIIFIIAFMLALTGALLESNILAAKTAFNETVARYSDISIAAGEADFTHGLATFVQLHGADGPWPQKTNQSALRTLCPSQRTGLLCAFQYVVNATITQASSAGPSTASGADPALNLQASVIDEQRVSAVVSVTISVASGAIVGSRTRYLTYRVFGTAPYAVVSGSHDSTNVNGSKSAAPGDSGGAAPPLDAAADTRIHVRLTCATIIANVVPFENDQQVAGNRGLSWGNAPQAAHETPCTSADAPADVFRDERWTNGNTNTSGWTQ